MRRAEEEAELAREEEERQEREAEEASRRYTYTADYLLTLAFLDSLNLGSDYRIQEAYRS